MTDSEPLHPSPALNIIRVALPLPIFALFDYLAPDACTDDLGRCACVPFGNSKKSGVIVALPDQSEIDVSRLKHAHSILRDIPHLPEDWLALTSFVASYYHAPLGEVIALALPPGLRRSVINAPEHEADPFLGLTAAAQSVLDGTHRRSKALSLVQTLSAQGPTRRSRLRLLPEGNAIGDALKRGWLAVVTPPSKLGSDESLPVLTTEQQLAITTIEARSGFVPWLLQGVTGSGKTEVYLRLAENVLRNGRQVLMLVPEIALTPQLEERVKRRFPHVNIISLHSGLGSAARTRGFLAALSGRADIVLGTRLAIFTPLPRLGLILVDEEHDTSYKQQEGLRYSARDIAVWRSRQCSIPIVLGSATPSLESWHHVQQAHYQLLRLTMRARASSLPKVYCIDTRRQTLDEGISATAVDAIAARLSRGEQSLVFLNRRGYAPVLSCTACGWISTCPNCSANRVVHLAEGLLRCHHCGSSSTFPHHCPQCGNQDLRPYGRGTQRVEQRLRDLFPQARVLRLDRDAARTRGQWEKLLAQIGNGEADILVGTQMMAKGHDFPLLTLVAVIGADASLYAADFRAAERLFQQLMQVGGRAGRADLPGEVLIQTESPEHALFQCLARHDFDAFARLEMQARTQSGFPPASFQAILRADAPQLKIAMDFLAQARLQALAQSPPPLRVFDPVPMRLTRLARRERAQLLLEANERACLQGFLRRWIPELRALRLPRSLRWQIDIDPLDV